MKKKSGLKKRTIPHRLFLLNSYFILYFMFHQENSSLVREYAGEKLVVEPWGKDSLRVRSTMRAAFEDEEWASASQRALRGARYLYLR